MASCTRFSRDICRMFPQNIWKLNQHRTSLQRESLYFIHALDRGTRRWIHWKAECGKSKIAKI